MGSLSVYRREIRRRMMVARRMKARRLPKWLKCFWIASYLLARAAYARQANLNNAAHTYCRYAERYIARLVDIMRSLEHEDIRLEERYSVLVDDLGDIMNVDPEWLAETIERRLRRAWTRTCLHRNFSCHCRLRRLSAF